MPGIQKQAIFDVPTTPSEGLPLGFVRRLALLGAILIAEWLPISVWVATGRGGQGVARGVVAFTAIFGAFAWLSSRAAILRLAAETPEQGIRWNLLCGHLGALAAFVELSLSPASGIPLAIAWYGTGVLSVVLAGLACFPFSLWKGLIQATGKLWIFASIAGICAARLTETLWSIWNGPLGQFTTDFTFGAVRWLLAFVLPDLTADRQSLTIGSRHFSVHIGGACSGLEGAGLILAFTIIWLYLFRSQCRFPHALLLLPAGVIFMYTLNTLRIAALILIGNAGAPGIAVGGFHSQAGWIAFNAVALGFIFAAPRVSWLKAERTLAEPEAAIVDNPTAPYLIPFASILAASMISRAASAGFEWLYPLRLLVAGAAIWHYRGRYAKLNWKPSRMALLGGAGVFALWIALSPNAAGGDSPMGAGLASLSPPLRIGWILCRILAAVITVPVAEELAFRGFLIRRLISSDFEALDLRRFTWLSLAASSVIFGLMHGEHWVAGIAAGLVYAGIMLRRGSIGDAVAAHSFTNALLAAWVLAGARWYLW